MTLFLTIVCTAVPAYIAGFAEWTNKRLQAHLDFLRKTSDEWFDKYMELLRKSLLK